MKKAGRIALTVLGVVVLAALGCWLFGGLEGGLAGLLALLPSGRRKLREARARGTNEGKLKQAEADQVASQAQRDEVADELAAIDERTEADVLDIRERWAERRGRPPTKEEEREMLDRFRPEGDS